MNLETELERVKKTRNQRPCVGTNPTHPTINAHFCTRSSEMIQQAEQKNLTWANNLGSPPSADLLFPGADAKVCREAGRRASQRLSDDPQGGSRPACLWPGNQPAVGLLGQRFFRRVGFRFRCKRLDSGQIFDPCQPESLEKPPRRHIDVGPAEVLRAAADRHEIPLHQLP